MYLVLLWLNRERREGDHRKRVRDDSSPAGFCLPLTHEKGKLIVDVARGR